MKEKGVADREEELTKPQIGEYPHIYKLCILQTLPVIHTYLMYRA